MNVNCWCKKPALRALIPSCALAFGMAHAADRTATHLDAAADNKVSLVTPATQSAAPQRKLDLRPPELRRVMAHSVLLSEIESSTEDEGRSVQVVAEPALMPMSFDSQAPLGLIGSLQWSVNHPTQAWRLILPSTLTP
jgi:hypothetical protein